MFYLKNLVFIQALIVEAETFFFFFNAGAVLIMLYHHLPHSCRSLPACEEKSSRGQGVGVALISVTSLLRNHTSPQRAQHLVPLHSQPYTCPSLSLPMGTLLKPPSRSFECEHPSFCQMHSLMQLAQPWCLRLCLFQN